MGRLVPARLAHRTTTAKANVVHTGIIKIWLRGQTRCVRPRRESRNLMGLWKRGGARGRLVTLWMLDVRWGSLLELVLERCVKTARTMPEPRMLGLKTIIRHR